MTIQEFIDARGLELVPTRIKRNPNMDPERTMSHWDCELRYRQGLGNIKTLNAYFSMGSAHKGSPKLDSILDCLISDGQAQGQAFEDWCADFGYDSDSRSAFKTYELCAKIGRDLYDFLGREAYSQLQDCERL